MSNITQIMLSTCLSVILILTRLFATNAQLTTLAQYTPTRCENNSDPYCFTSFSYPKACFARSGNPILLYAAEDFFDLCRDFELPSTCVDYFCGNPFPIYDSFIRKKHDPGQYHITFLHYCYYCNYTTRAEFFKRLNGGNCSYYWKPPTNWYCKQGNPTLTTRYAYENYNRMLDPKSPLIYANVPAMLNTTLRRIMQGNENGSIESAIASSYYCYCLSSNRYGMLCDEYTDFWIPLRYNALPPLAIFFRLILLFVLLYLIWVPRIEQLWRDTMANNYSWKSFGKFIWGQFEKLPFHVVFFLSLGIIFLTIEDFIFFSPPNAPIRKMDGNFSIIGWFVIFISYTTLLVIWVNIYERTNSMSNINVVATKFKVFLAIFYVIDISVCIAGLIALNYLQTHSSRYYINIGRVIMDVFAFGFTFLLSFGFLIYGSMMYRILRSVDQKTSIWKIKFTQFMLISVPFMWYTCIWLLLYIIQDQLLILGSWLNLFISNIIDLNFSLLYILIIFVLYDGKLLKKMILHSYIEQQYHKWKDSKNEKELKELLIRQNL